MSKSTIEWTAGDDGSMGETWNPLRGCSVTSPGCHRCYARTIAARFSDPGRPFHGFALRTVHGPQWTGKVELVPEHLADPLSWKKPRRIFVNSMSDLFHESLSNESIAAIFGVMAACPQHTFQVLTKRAARMREWCEWVENRPMSAGGRMHPIGACALEATDRGICGTWGSGSSTERAQWPLSNVWLGVSAEDQQRADERIPELLQTPAAVRFVSYEPALGPVDFSKWLEVIEPIEDDPHATFLMQEAVRLGQGDAPRRLSWLIAGGESGPGARPFDLDWARSVVAQCRDAGVACFVKQMGAKPFDSAGPIVDGVRTTEVSLASRKGGEPSEWGPGDWPRDFPRVTHARD